MGNEKLLPPVYFVLYIFFAFLLNFFTPLNEIIPSPYSFIGYVLIILGFMLNSWARYVFIKSKTTIHPFGKSKFLIKKGPFKYSRNPIYLAFFIILFGIGISLGSIGSLLSAIAFIFTMNKKFIIYEENDLEKTFGNKYLSYKQKVRRWI